MDTPEWVKTAKVGDKVRCIGQVETYGYSISTPKIGDVVTIRYIGMIGGGEEGVGFLFEEHHNLNWWKQHWGKEAFESGFMPINYKPLKNTDISMFTSMLNKTSQDNREAV